MLAGVDEVGRGPLAGPVLAAAVILDPNRPIVGLQDSKCLSPKKRALLAEMIRQNAYDFGIGQACAQEIDTYNILQATLLAMKRAISALRHCPDVALIDGQHSPQLSCHVRTLVRGDQICLSISAASILAKVIRDDIMLAVDLQYPEYGFAQHKGYGTSQHLTALKHYGYTPAHRYSFKPVRECLKQYPGSKAIQ